MPGPQRHVAHTPSRVECNIGTARACPAALSPFFQEGLSSGFRVHLRYDCIRSKKPMSAALERRLQPHIEAWHRAGVISRSNEQRSRRHRFLFEIAAIPKADGTLRPILNCKPATRGIHKPQLRMFPAAVSFPIRSREAPRSSLYFLKYDFSNFFFHFRLHPSSAEKLCFRYKHTIYRFDRLPMGLRTAPAP